MFGTDEYSPAFDEDVTCVVLYPREGGVETDFSRVLASQPAPFVMFTTQAQPDRSFLERSLALLATSSTLEGVLSWHDGAHLCLTRKALDKFGPISDRLEIVQLIEALKRAALVHRRFYFMEVGVAPKHAARTSSVIVSAPPARDFQALGATFTLAMDGSAPASPSVEPGSAMTEKEVVGLINEAVGYLNARQSSSALSTIARIEQAGIEIPDLIFLKAVAQAHTGGVADAVKSLWFLMEKNPNHQQGRELLTTLSQQLAP